MENRYEISSSLQSLLDHVEEQLAITIHLQRKPEAPRKGILLDSYSFDTTRNVIAFSNQQIGMLKDFVIGQNAIRLLLKGIGHKNNVFQVLSFTEESVTSGMEQIYLDVLKDEKTRHMEFWMKKKLMFYLYMLFFETLIELPGFLFSNIVISRMCPVMRNAQVYYLMKESMRDMHDLVSFKDYIPRRYFVMHNGMFYARDLILGEIMSEMKLNPMINIPELKKFKNLNLMEMLTHRWQKNPWYQTKLVGDAMVSIMKEMKVSDVCHDPCPDTYLLIYQLIMDLTNRWISLMQLDKYYVWETPEHQQAAIKNQNTIENAARMSIFGEV
ncbi:MAG: hypothetical protein JXA44_01610 [Methanospirillaceae archaeon]|nr:hypothetical protein [Methanospirillaceae archaeon]